MAAFDEGADSDEVHAKKGGKSNKDKKQHQGKKKKGKQESDPEDEPEAEADGEEAKVAEDAAEGDNKEEAEQKEPEPAIEYPLNVTYCGSKLFGEILTNIFMFFIGCGLPPEYCSFGQKDISDCIKWLREHHPVLAT